MARGVSQINPRLSILRSHPFFIDLDAKALDQLCQYVSFRKFKRGATVFVRGDPGNSLFVVVSGAVKMSVASSEGRSAILNLVTKGEVFGEIALLDGLARTADAIAHTNCELIVIDRRDFFPFIESQPMLAMKFIHLLCARLRWTSEQVEHVILQDLPARLANLLIGLALKHEPSDVGRPFIVTQQEIGEMVGVTRESINKQLRAWSLKGWIRLEPGSIAILKPKALAAVAEAEPATLDASGRPLKV